MSSIQDIEAILNALPPGANPYLAIFSVFQADSFPVGNLPFFANLYFLMVLDSIIVFLCLATLSIHYVRGTLWVFRLKRSTNGTFIISNALISWLIPGSVFYLLSIVYIEKQLEHLRDSKFVGCLAIFSFLVWIPAFNASWLVLTNTAGSYLIKRADNSTSFFRSGLFFNSILITIPIINLATLLPFGIKTQLNADVTQHAYENLEAYFISAAKTFDPKTFSIIDLLPAVVPAKALGVAGQTLLNSVTVVGCLLTGWALFILVVGLIFSILQLRSLSKDISKAQSYSTQSRGGDWGSKGREVRSLFHTLISIVVAFSIMALNFAGCSLYIAIDPQSALGNSVNIEVYTLTILYSFTLPGLIITATVFKRALNGAPVPTTARITVPNNATLSYAPWMSNDEIQQSQIHSQHYLKSSFMNPTRGINFDEKSGLNLELVELGSPTFSSGKKATVSFGEL